MKKGRQKLSVLRRDVEDKFLKDQIQLSQIKKLF
jgi:hypothetical protein